MNQIAIHLKGDVLCHYCHLFILKYEINCIYSGANPESGIHKKQEMGWGVGGDEARKL